MHILKAIITLVASFPVFWIICNILNAIKPEVAGEFKWVGGPKGAAIIFSLIAGYGVLTGVIWKSSELIENRATINAEQPVDAPSNVTKFIPDTVPSSVEPAENKSSISLPPKTDSTSEFGHSKLRKNNPTRSDETTSKFTEEKLSEAIESQVKRPNKDSIDMNISDLKGDLAATDAKIQIERNRWRDALGVINKLTNNKKTPVSEGSVEYHKCLAASRIIQEVEAGAPALKAEKARLEEMIRLIESE